MILGVSFDTVEENYAFATKFHFNFPLICDTDRKIGLAYGATSPGEKSGAKRIGVIINPDGTIREWHPKVDARAWPAAVIESL